MLRIALVLAAAATLSLATARAQEPPLTVDTEMLRWNDQIPGFGGFFYDEAGRGGPTAGSSSVAWT